jgi:hypothetical protein
VTSLSQSWERDPGPERERLRAALGALADLDRRIDALGAELKRMGG